MKNIKSLLDAIELNIEIEELRELGLTEEDIAGFLQMFCESWVNEEELVKYGD